MVHMRGHPRHRLLLTSVISPVVLCTVKFPPWGSITGKARMYNSPAYISRIIYVGCKRGLSVWVHVQQTDSLLHIVHCYQHLVL